MECVVWEVKDFVSRSSEMREDQVRKLNDSFSPPKEVSRSSELV